MDDRHSGSDYQYLFDQPQPRRKRRGPRRPTGEQNLKNLSDRNLIDFALPVVMEVDPEKVIWDDLIPLRVDLDKNLRRAAQTLGAIQCIGGGKCMATAAELADMVCLPLATVEGHLRALAGNGLIVVSQLSKRCCQRTPAGGSWGSLPHLMCPRWAMHRYTDWGCRMLVAYLVDQVHHRTRIIAKQHIDPDGNGQPLGLEQFVEEEDRLRARLARSSVRKIQEKTGLSTSTISKAIEKLASDGLIIREMVLDGPHGKHLEIQFQKQVVLEIPRSRYHGQRSQSSRNLLPADYGIILLESHAKLPGKS